MSEPRFAPRPPVEVLQQWTAVGEDLISREVRVVLVGERVFLERQAQLGDGATRWIREPGYTDEQLTAVVLGKIGAQLKLVAGALGLARAA